MLLGWQDLFTETSEAAGTELVTFRCTNEHDATWLHSEAGGQDLPHSPASLWNCHHKPPLLSVQCSENCWDWH